MNKKKKQLLLSLTLLITLVIYVVYLTVRNGGWSGRNNTFVEEIGDFSIKDTASIYQITITDQDKNKAVIQRKEKGYWQVNGKHRARIESIDLILYTCKMIEVKSQVPIAARETIIRNLSVNYKKVEFFDAKNKWIKTWYVGGATKDNEGSYMILEDENGKAEVPCITYIPSFVGHLSSRFFCSEREWRFTGIFNYDPLDIASVKIINYDSLAEGFEIKVLDKNRFALYNAFDKPVPVFDTAAVRQYLVNYKKIHFQSFNPGTLTEKQEDSLRKAKPYYKILVTDKKGIKNELTIYHKKTPPIDELGEPWEMEVDWDPIRSFAILSSGEVVIIQFGVFDRILWPIYAFTHSTRLQPQIQ